ncbi:MAG: hypothetical protein IK025_02840 [Bacteroidales bacterium]|nr:hypothetical protein [Bacteroidales bacterium]
MAIDKATLEQYTNAYKNLVDDMKSKNITGKHYDEAERSYNRMIELGEQCSDMTDFQTKVNSENLYGNITNSYSQAITEYMQQSMGAAAAPSVASGIGATVASSVIGSAIGSATANVPGLNAIPRGVVSSGTVNIAVDKAKGLFSFFKKKKDGNDDDSRQYKTRRT